MDQSTLGQRLKEARTNCGVSQEAAAQALGVPRTAIVHIEAGNRSISTVELVQLAELYSRPVTEFFREPEMAQEDNALVAINRVAPEYRDDAQVKEAITRCIAICHEGVTLEGMLGMKPRIGPPAYSLPSPRTTIDAVRQGQFAADEERKRLALGDNPVLDMSDLLCSQGIWATGASLPDEMSGLFLQLSSIGLFILVNFDHPRTRKRFSYAHEYAHALLDRKFSASVSTAHNRRDLSEVRANAFAAALLMPSRGVQAFLASRNKGAASRESVQVYDVMAEENKEPVEAHARAVPDSQKITFQVVALLSYHFEVSYMAAAYRLRSLDYLNHEQLAAVLRQEKYAIEFLNLLQAEDCKGDCYNRGPDRQLVAEVTALAMEAFRRDEISSRKLLELAEVLGVEGRRLVELARVARA